MQMAEGLELELDRADMGPSHHFPPAVAPPFAVYRVPPQYCVGWLIEQQAGAAGRTELTGAASGASRVPSTQNTESRAPGTGLLGALGRTNSHCQTAPNATAGALQSPSNPTIPL